MLETNQEISKCNRKKALELLKEWEKELEMKNDTNEEIKEKDKNVVSKIN